MIHNVVVILNIRGEMTQDMLYYTMYVEEYYEFTKSI